MNAKQLLKLYANGKRDFRGENLRGLSFKNQDLSRADFSDCDIRGTNFSGANLTQAKFINAKAGLPKRWVVILLLFCLFLATVAGYAGTYVGVIIFLIYDKSLNYQIIGWLGLLSILSINFLFYFQGINLLATALAGILTGVLALAVVVVQIMDGALAAGVTVAVGIAGALALSIAVSIALAGVLAGFLTLIVSTASAIVATIVLNEALDVAIEVDLSLILAVEVAGAVALARYIAVPLVMFNSYLGWRAIKGDPRDRWIRFLALEFASIGATSFHKSNLTGADFTRASLKNVKFDQAILIHTRFRYAKKLHLVSPAKTYLKNLQVQKLIITGEGKGINLDYQDLSGINLEESNLEGVSFIGTNLSHANLQSANLSNSKLVKAELDNTDFTSATLTGAYIQDWRITSHTKFDDIICLYVYMRLPTTENPNPQRKPDNFKEEFARGDFSDFIKPILDTLDLYHTGDIDPRAISIALKNLIENNPEAKIAIKTLEERGNNFLIRLATSSVADRSKLSSDYFKDYNEIKTLNQVQKALLSEKDVMIKTLENIIIFIHKNNTHNYYFQGDSYMTDQSKNVNINNSNDITGIVLDDNTGVVGKDMNAVAGDNISGPVTVSIGELAQSNIPEAPKIADLLKQLQSAIESETNLSEKDKTKALKQIQVLAEAGKNPQDEEKKGLAETAVDILKGVLFMEIPSLAGTVEVFKQLLPLIQAYFGL